MNNIHCRDCKYLNQEAEGKVCTNRKSEMFRKYAANTCTCEAGQLKEEKENE